MRIGKIILALSAERAKVGPAYSAFALQRVIVCFGLCKHGGPEKKKLNK
jgi:hypothetical protein